MKKLIILLILGFAAYSGWKHFNNKSASSSAEVTNPVYVEFRVKLPEDIELVGFGKMDSMEDCETRSTLFWRSVLTSNGQAEMTSAKCGVTLPTRYLALFENKPANATYISFDRGNAEERDGRFIIYGAPSSEVMKICPMLIETMQKNFRGEIKCVQGRIG